MTMAKMRLSRRIRIAGLALCLIIASCLSVVALDGTNHNLLRVNQGETNVTSSSTQDSIEAALVLPLHAASGTHHITLYVGEPPQPQVLILDTGSRLTAWTCDPCRNCGAQSSNAPPRYSPSQSSTQQPNPCGECELSPRHNSDCQALHQSNCQVVQKYTEGSSWEAYEISEIVTLYSAQAVEWTVPFTFGCQTSLSGLFRKQYANGILGLERSKLSLIHHLKATGLIERNAFSLCIGSGTRPSGAMGIGGAVTPLHWEEMRYSPLVREKGVYAVRVEEVWLGSTCVAQPSSKLAKAFDSGKGTILDSGTTDTFLPRALTAAFGSAWETQTKTPFSQAPRWYTYEEFLQLPTMVIHFQGNATLRVPPLHYMEAATAEKWSGNRELTNRIYADEPEGAVLGLNAQRGHDILYDADGERLGFARADCDGKIDVSTS